MRRRVGSARVWKVSSYSSMHIQAHQVLSDAFQRLFILPAFRRSFAAARRPQKVLPVSCHPDFVWTAFTIRGECFQQCNAVCLWNWPSFMIISSLLRFCSKVMSLTGLPSIKSRSAR
jgi:hypothetical protein